MNSSKIELPCKLHNKVDGVSFTVCECKEPAVKLRQILVRLNQIVDQLIAFSEYPSPCFGLPSPTSGSSPPTTVAL